MLLEYHFLYTLLVQTQILLFIIFHQNVDLVADIESEHEHIQSPIIYYRLFVSHNFIQLKSIKLLIVELFVLNCIFYILFNQLPILYQTFFIEPLSTRTVIV